VNVGVGAWQAEGPRLRDHLERVCGAHGLRPEELEGVRGHRLPLRRPGTQIASERALLVGDAAGLIDPVSGDGMYECFVSARLAASAIEDVLSGCSSSLESYSVALDAAVGPLHRSSWKLKRALDRWPRASWRVARTALLWRSVERILMGELSAPSEERGSARIPLRVLDALGRLGR
jgi:flavin-dependent dehydrogenase